MSPYPRSKPDGGFSKSPKKYVSRAGSSSAAPFKSGYGEKKGSYAPRNSFGDKPMAHDAVCDVCHKPCRVPFKPNGSKPVLCTNCFKKDRGAESTYSGKRSFSADRTERIPGAFGRSKPAGYGSPMPARSAAPADNGKIEARLAAIEGKVDRILKALAGNDGQLE